MKKMPITVWVSQRVPERVWRDALAKLGEMQKEAIGRGIGTDWKCEFRHETGIFFVSQKDREFMICRDGDKPQHVKRGLRIEATAYVEEEPPAAAKPGLTRKPEAVLQGYRDEVIREVKRLAVANPSQQQQLDVLCEELARCYQKPIGIGFLAEMSSHDTAKHIIDSLRKPR